MFNFFVLYLDVVVTAAKKEGKFNEGFVDLTGNSMSMHGEPKSVFTTLCDGCRLDVDKCLNVIHFSILLECGLQCCTTIY